MCKMSEEWILQMNVDSHPPGRHQPFYNVLAQGQWKVGSTHCMMLAGLYPHLVMLLAS